MDKTFHVLEVDGFNAGDVVHTTNGHGFAWEDSIILGFTEPDKHGDTYAKLSRPFVYVSSAGTTSPSPLVGIETYTVTVAGLKERFLKRSGSYIK